MTSRQAVPKINNTFGEKVRSNSATTKMLQLSAKILLWKTQSILG